MQPGIWNPLSSHSSLFVIKNQKNPLTLTAPITQIQINKPCSPNFSNDEASSSPFQSLTCSNPSKSLNPHRSIVLSPVRFVVLLFVCSLVVSDNEASLSLLRFDVPVIATPPPPEPSLTASRSLPLAVDYHHQLNEKQLLEFNRCESTLLFLSRNFECYLKLNNLRLKTLILSIGTWSKKLAFLSPICEQVALLCQMQMQNSKEIR
ncbi:hypothetical protein P8452_08733 [Trifolium repens]|nr:hypothetical protein P8452_08733 [Trifolium repens]